MDENQIADYGLYLAYVMLALGVAGITIVMLRGLVANLKGAIPALGGIVAFLLLYAIGYSTSKGTVNDTLDENYKKEQVAIDVVGRGECLTVIEDNNGNKLSLEVIPTEYENSFLTTKPVYYDTSNTVEQIRSNVDEKSKTLKSEVKEEVEAAFRLELKTVQGAPMSRVKSEIDSRSRDISEKKEELARTKKGLEEGPKYMKNDDGTPKTKWTESEKEQIQNQITELEASIAQLEAERELLNKDLKTLEQGYKANMAEKSITAVTNIYESPKMLDNDVNAELSVKTGGLLRSTMYLLLLTLLALIVSMVRNAIVR